MNGTRRWSRVSTCSCDRDWLAPLVPPPALRPLALLPARLLGGDAVVEFLDMLPVLVLALDRALVEVVEDPG